MKKSAGLLVYKKNNSSVQVLIVHPGGPYFTKKDVGVWSIPKGIIDDGEKPLDAAKREFKEEIGIDVPEGKLLEIGEAKYPSGSKSIVAWAVEGEIDLTEFKSNLTTVEWPPRSGKNIEIPEIDRAGWFDLDTAAIKMFRPQVVFLERLATALGVEFKLPKDEQKQIGLL